MGIDMSAMPSHLRFPPEILRNITENFRCRKSLDELSYLWTTVRLVSRQFKDDVEDIFRTEHLRKTWLYLDNSEIDDLYVKLYFDTIQSQHPGRAVFSSRLDTKNRARQWEEMSKTLLARVGTGRLSEADRSVPESRMRLYTCPPGLFVVQVRGSVCDCAIPSLDFNVNPLRLELSFEWRDLFHRFFGERKIVGAVLDSAPEETRTCNPLDLQVSGPRIEAVDQLNQTVSPDLRALAQLDLQTHHRHMQISNQAALRASRLESPIKTWADTMGKHLGQLNPTLERCRLRRLADQRIDLDDEGRVNQKRMHYERESIRAAKFKGRTEWSPLIQACDACRKMNVHCERGHPVNSVYGDCNSCTEAGSPCDSSLAQLNMSRRHYVVPTTRFKDQAPFDHNARGNQRLQDYVMQKRLLNERLSSIRQLRATTGAIVRPRFNNLAPPGPDVRQTGWMIGCSLENHRTLQAINDEQDPGEGTSQRT